MLREQITGENTFGRLGGVRLLSEVRNGQVRSQGVFQHALLAGTFAATLVPLFFALGKAANERLLPALGVIASIAMVVSSACSTPIVTLAAAITGICLWGIRRYMYLVRYALCTALIGLHLVMKAPVWALIQRIDITSGNSSYHRYQLIDQFIRHWSDWWLIGTRSNAEWGHLTFDAANQYVAEGTYGGILALAFFIAQIVWCFRRLGVARRHVAKTHRHKEWLIWLLGASLFAHVVGFFGISYFDQTRVAWFALLAMICTVTSSKRTVVRTCATVDRDLDGCMFSGHDCLTRGVTV